ncbi:axonemal 84 kDa protein-like [Acyrthosiphon pisum]|uniref:Axonemal 84 kDa protein n=1 Tax=Acyrthosiphon pisum TaxID=7029 RepID=A0A8R1W485_ACYPI|nr:axonemal 84 kDa protein-like [Acyrthosiphon pisum]|eukprot:XP_003241246.1 PREDICTED: axonemal 84 kDa protein-like [Acyrthosiphon pisum]
MAKRFDGKMKTPNSGPKFKSKSDARQSQQLKRDQKALLEKQKEREFRIIEHQLRSERLKPNCAMLSDLSRKKYEHDRKYREELDWQHWIRCDGTPNPQVIQELNTYLFVERQVRHVSDDKNSYVEKCLEIFKIMDAVDDIVDLPLDFSQFKLQCFREARDNLGRLLVEIVYGICYHLISDYDRRMDPVDLETVAYKNSCEAFAVGLHVVCHRPRLLTDDRPPPKCDFPECLVMVDVPPQLSQQYMAVMALWLRWDPFTDRMAEFDVSKSFEMDTRDLWQYSEDMWKQQAQIIQLLDEEKERSNRQLWMEQMEEKLKAFAEVDRSSYPADLITYLDELEKNDPHVRPTSDDIEKEEKKQEDQRNDVDIKDEPPKPVEPETTKSIQVDVGKSPSQLIEMRQLEEMEDISNSLKYSEKPNELNPRRYWIIGGAFNVEMWKLPMQPVEFEDGSVGVLIVGPEALQPIDYHEKYEPLQLSMGFSSTSSEDEETDVKKQNQEALKRLALINIKLPENVLWFENPKPAMWNEEKKNWTTEYIYDIRFNEEKQMVSFRAGRMGSFGLAVNRYTNFPFQSWEIRPEGGGDGAGVVLSVTAATVLVEFAVREDQAAMVQLQNATTVALQEMIGAYHRPDKLVRLLRRGGINLFPEPDARHYVDGNRPPKHAVAERHAYRCMAALSSTHQFAASRWNVNAPFDRMVMQMKETQPAVEAAGSGTSLSVASGQAGGVPYKMVMVTPERAVLLKCTEVSQVFSEEPLEVPPDSSAEAGQRFAPDLLTLTGHSDTVDFKTTETLFYLMDKIKFLSYS